MLVSTAGRTGALHAVLLIAIPVCLFAVGTAAQESSSGIPEGLTDSDWTSLRAAWEEQRLAAVSVETGFLARNSSQQWTTRFDGHGFTVSPHAGSWEWGLELKRFGFEGHENDVVRPLSVDANGKRVTYAWDWLLEEWFINDGRGVEHGYFLRERPSTAAARLTGIDAASPSLMFMLGVRGGLEPRIEAGGLGARFLDEDGAVVLIYSGLMVFDADGTVLPARLELADKELAIRIDERGARYPVTIDPLVQGTYLKSSNSNQGDEFGWSLAVSGETAVVGAISEDSNATGVNGDQSNNVAPSAGAAYVFVRDGMSWRQEAYLKASNTGASDGFGVDVAISGDTIVVGAFGEASSASGVNGNQGNNGARTAGAAYVFVRNGTSWSQEAYLKASNTAASDRFGVALAICGDTIAIAADSESSNATGVNGNQANNSALQSGAVYVFVRNGTTWSQEAYIKASNTGPGDGFGPVSLSGDTLIVGAPAEDSSATGVNGNQNDNGATNAGAAYVFLRTGTTWSQEAYLKASNAEAGDTFGSCVGLSGDTAIVGAFNEDSSATGINGNQSNNQAGSAGAVYVFVRGGSTWSQQAYLKASNTDFGDQFGLSACVEGDRVLVGARLENGGSTGVNGNENDNSAINAGAAYLFGRTGTSWSQQSYLKASNTEAGDEFGLRVAMSGTTVMVGAPKEDSGSHGVNGLQNNNTANRAGAAYLFVDNSARVSSRTAAPNPVSYAAGNPVIGTTFSLTVDLSTTGHDVATIHANDAPGFVTLGQGQVVLIGGNSLFLLGPMAGPSANFTVDVPNELSIIGVTIYTQAVHAGGVTPFALSNALDFTAGL